MGTIKGGARPPASKQRETRPTNARRAAREGTKRAAASLKGHDAAEMVNSLRRLFKAIHEYSKAIFQRTGLSGPQLWALT